MAPFTAGEDSLRDLLDCKVRIPVRLSTESRAHDEQRAVLSHVITELLKPIVTQVLRGYIDKISLRGVAMLPIDRIARSVDESFQLADCLGKHRCIVCFINDPVAPLVFFQERRGET